MSDLPEMALSIRQPWAWAILHAGKTIENRSWPTRFRVRGMSREEFEDCLGAMHHISRSHPFPTGLTLPAFDALDRGGIVGMAEIVECVDRSDSPWFFGEFGFVLRNARSVPFIPVRGALGFFKWKDRVTG